LYNCVTTNEQGWMRSVFQSLLFFHRSFHSFRIAVPVQWRLEAKYKADAHALFSSHSFGFSLSRFPFSAKMLESAFRTLFSLLSSLASTSSIDQSPPIRSKYGGIQLEETVEAGSEKSRLDAWITSRIRIRYRRI
jgi:hypothetical protein